MPAAQHTSSTRSTKRPLAVSTQPQHVTTIRASASSKQNKKEDENMAPKSMYDEEYDDAPINQGLLNKKRKSIRDSLHIYYDTQARQIEWMRPYWLGSSLFLLLFAFWVLDSLKDPLFARLVDGKIERHQPTAKLCSVASTLVLVCLMEYLANLRQRRTAEERENEMLQDQVLDAGGVWKSGTMYSQEYQRRKHQAVDDTISITIFYQIGIPYVFAFVVIAFFVAQFEGVEDSLEEGFDAWYILAYVLHATVESFGSIAVATFWSFTNSTLSLNDAERYYGPIIALAQFGAIGGSTMVASGGWNVPSMLVVVSLVIILQMLVMRLYHQRFLPTSLLAINTVAVDSDEQSVLTWQDNDATLTKPFWSGIYLIFNHYYVILILGVSCLYEVALTCLDYQMKLLGYAKFAATNDPYAISATSPTSIMATMSFAEFMGRYGQVVNFVSLLFSSLVFPTLIRRYGLRVTLRIFPTLLLIITIIAYGAFPGNLTVLFVSLSLLKAMTYSVHDPSKELLYIPTSNAVKFRAKFWIDVVGERISKAIGGLFNTFAGSVEKSIRIGSVPSIISAAGLWFVCFYVGIEFDRLLRTGTIVGLEHSVDPATYKKVPKREQDGQDDDDDDDDNNRRDFPPSQGEPSEINLQFGEEGSFSTLGLDTVEDEVGRQDKSFRMPPVVVRI
jgi:AAA family ATP:ADP antiporter